MASSSSDKTVENLSDVFRCFICMEKLRNAHLCPHCSKLCCYECIQRWLTEQRSQCPHCRAALHSHELVNIRWVQDVTSQLEILKETKEESFSSHSSGERCSVHPEDKLSVYCINCKGCICHQCALWGGKSHSGHTFKPLSSVYEKVSESLKFQVLSLRKKLLELISSSQEVEKSVDAVRAAKDERVREIRNSVELIIARLDSQLKHKLLRLMTHKNALTRDTEVVENLLSEIDRYLNVKSRSDLICKSEELLLAAEEINKKPFLRGEGFGVGRTDKSVDFVSEIVPRYEGALFRLSNFRFLQEKAEPLYSSPLNVNGLSWRLKVYPDGNGVVRGTYLSVFLELSSGLSEPSKYEYRVEMFSKNSSKNVVREFASDFEVGECWGYNRFFRLDLLHSDGYVTLDPNSEDFDSLLLKFSVRPPTYFQQCRDQQWYIHQLQALQAGYAAQIAESKNTLALQMSSSGLPLLLPPSESHSNHGVFCTYSQTPVSESQLTRPNIGSEIDFGTLLSTSSESNDESSEELFEEGDDEPYSGIAHHTPENHSSILSDFDSLNPLSTKNLIVDNTETLSDEYREVTQDKASSDRRFLIDSLHNLDLGNYHSFGLSPLRESRNNESSSQGRVQRFNSEEQPFSILHLPPDSILNNYISYENYNSLLQDVETIPQRPHQVERSSESIILARMPRLQSPPNYFLELSEQNKKTKKKKKDSESK